MPLCHFHVITIFKSTINMHNGLLYRYTVKYLTYNLLLNNNNKLLLNKL